MLRAREAGQLLQGDAPRHCVERREQSWALKERQEGKRRMN
jgi:hypothetical protein